MSGEVEVRRPQMPGEAARPDVHFEILSSHGGDYWVTQVRDCPSRENAELVMRALIRQRYSDADLWAIDEVRRERRVFTRTEARCLPAAT